MLTEASSEDRELHVENRTSSQQVKSPTLVSSKDLQGTISTIYPVRPGIVVTILADSSLAETQYTDSSIPEKIYNLSNS